MNDDGPWVLPLTAAHDVGQVGGKAASLARMLASGLPVPPGFAVTTAAFHAWEAAGRDDVPDTVQTALTGAYRTLGRVPLAVRSSATAEDGAEMSMAGQYETILGVQGEEALIAAVRRCWQASGSARVTSYLASHGIVPGSVALALVIQRLVPADAAGVLFTANPRNGRRTEMLLEAAWGLGEAVVSGHVQPDVLTLEHATGHVLEATIAEKAAIFDPATGKLQPPGGGPSAAPVLSSPNVLALAQWGRRIEALYGAPQDIEWAVYQGRIHLLQSRPITTLAVAAAREVTRVETRRRLIAALDAGQGPWIVHNLGETAPRPTPLTWAVLQRFMSGQGGYGRLQRAVGFTPGPAVEAAGFLELIGGRIYMDVRRGPEMFGAGFPYRYDLDRLRADPEAANGPPTVPSGSLSALGRAGRLVQAVERRLTVLAETSDQQLEQDIIPAYMAWVAVERQRDLSKLTAAEWTALWRAREHRTMDEFAPQALLPSILCVWATDRLRRFLEVHFWDDDPDGLLATLSVPARGDATLKSNDGLRELAGARLSLEAWLQDYGHRAPEEFELATPRWSERPAAVASLAEHWRGREDPASRHAERQQAVHSCLNDLRRRLTPRAAAELDARVTQLSRYLPYREDGKHYLMHGYALLRDLASEAARRLGVGDGIFLLTPGEIDGALKTGYAPHALIEERRLQRAAEQELDLPPLLTRPEIDRIGEPPAVDPTAERWKASPLAGGRASGPVRILTAPDQVSAGERGFVLVCTTTDTGWTPLFASAVAVVVERGGSLSHGAVVAREMGVPAVTLAGATRHLRDGEIVTVDGQHGWVLRGALSTRATEQAEAADADVVTRKMRPPPPGPVEARAARWRWSGFMGWGLFLAAFFLLPPDWLHDPIIRALDGLLWPLVAAGGKITTVALIAAVTATATLIGQRMLNDHRRLVTAKQRWQRLQTAARALPEESPRRSALSAAGAGVQTRLTLAAFTPLAVLLGPMVLSFIWLTERIDPAVWNPVPGSTAEIVASLQGDHRDAVTLELPETLRLAAHSAAEQRLPPIRQTLEQLLARWQAAAPDETLSWDVRAAAHRTRTELLDDLRAFLARPMPAQALAWTVELPRESGGRFNVTLRTGDAPAETLTLVTGDVAPPSPRATNPSEAGPVRELRVDYREPRVRGDRVFWAPFAQLGWSWDAGWLGVYLLVYLPVMAMVRRVLRLP